MNNLKYIPGDLVMTNGVPLGTEKDVIYRVVSSEPSTTLELNYGAVLKGVVYLENIEGTELGDKGYLFSSSCASIKDISPIPLTAEIFEKNGWIHKMDFVYDTYTKGDYKIYKSIREPGIYNVYCGRDSFLLRNVMYVHELQHLFFGLGLNHEMEV